MSVEESKLSNILDFFKNSANFAVLYEFIVKTPTRPEKLSLRLLDWFVTNYSKQHSIVLNILRFNRIVNFFVWLEYQNALDSNGGKEHFDPFGRGKNNGKTLELEYEPGKCIRTTLSQLCFFQWAIKNKITDYVKENIDAIYLDMETRNKKNTTGKKHKLSVSVSQTLGIHNVQMAVRFPTV